MNYINSLIYGFKKCFFILFLAFFIWGCDSSETQEEDGSLNVSNNPGGTDDDEVTQFEVSVVTPISTITTSYTPPFAFYSSKSGTISYTGSCIGDLTQAVAGNNSMKIYSASSTPPVYIPLSSGQYESCTLTIIDADGTNKSLKIDDFVVTDPNSQTGQILQELQSSLSDSSSSSRMSGRMGNGEISLSPAQRGSGFSKDQVKTLILAGAKTVQTNNLLNSSDLTLAMPTIVEGTMKKLSEIGLSGSDAALDLGSKIVSSLVKSINGRKAYLNTSTSESGESPLQSLMTRMSKATLKNLRSAGFDVQSVSSASSTLVSSMIQNLDEAGLDASDIGTAVESISIGAVGSLGDVEGIDTNTLQNSISEITSKASESLNKLGLPASSLSSVVEKITQGAAKGLGNIKGNNGDLTTMMEKVTEGAVKGLGKLRSSGTNTSDIQSMIEKATLGAMKALEKYPNEMVALVEKITSGATRGLSEFEINDISNLIEKITTGATEGIGQLKTNSSNVSDEKFGSMIEKSTTGAVGQLGSLNIDSSAIDGLVSKARSGASTVLDKLAETNSSFDAEKLKKNIDSGANTGMSSQGWSYVTKVSSNSSDQWFSTPNENIDITIEFNQEVFVQGKPKLELLFSNGTRSASYESGNGNKRLTFRYQLQNGDESPQLRYENSASLKLNGGSIKAMGKPSLLVLPAPGTPTSLNGVLALSECSSNKRMVIVRGKPRCYRNEVRVDLQKPQNVQFKVTSDTNPAWKKTIKVDFSANDGTGVTGFIITKSNEVPNYPGDWTTQSPVPNFSQRSVNHSLMDGDRDYKLYIHFRDDVGHVSTLGIPSFKLDTTGPQGSLVINDQNERTNSIQVQTIFNGNDPHDVVEYALSESNIDPGNFFQFPMTGQQNIKFGKGFNLSPIEGNKTIHLWLKDRVGNIGGPYQDVIELDTTKPILSHVGILSDNPIPHLAKSGNLITLSFKTSESVFEPDVQILGEKALVQPFENNSKTYWKATLNAKDSSPEGQAGFTIKATDLAGNISDEKKSTDDISIVKVDLTKPENTFVNITSDNRLSPNLAKEGDTITLKFNMNESIQKPDVKINNSQVDVHSDDNGGGIAWMAKYVIKDTDPESKVEFSVVFMDLAGNSGIPIETAASPQKIEMDTVKPVFQSVSIQSNHTNPELAKYPNKLILNFLTSEIVKKPANSDFTVSGVENPVVSGTGDGKNWTISGDIKKNYDGLVNFRIMVEDLAGNWSDNQTSTKNGSSVLVDNNAPVLNSIEIVSNNTSNKNLYAKSDDVIRLKFTSSENLQRPNVTLGGIKQNVSLYSNSAATTPTIEFSSNSGSSANGILTLADNQFAELSKDIMKDWGVGDFEISLSIKARSGNKIAGNPNRDYAALFIKSTQASSPYTGPSAFVWNNGKVSFRLHGDESMVLPGAVSSWTNWVDLRFKFSSALKKVQIFVNGEEKGSKILSKTVNASYFLNAPLRFGGNHVDPLDQSLNADIKNLYISGINQPIGQDWQVTTTVNNNSPNKVVDFAIEYQDIVGNAGDNRTQANSNTNSIRVDTLAPLLQSLSMSTNNADSSKGKNGDRLTLSFSANENLDVNSLKLKLNGVDKNVTSSGNKWQLEHIFTDLDTEGPISIVLNYKDLAGNSGTEKKSTLDGSSVDFDRTQPTFTVGFSRDGPYKKGDTFDLDINFSEDLHPDSQPRLKINVVQGTSYSKLLTKISPRKFSLNFSPVDGNGSAVLSIDNQTAKDPAGNPIIEIPVSGKSFQLDNTIPTASVSYASVGPYKKGDDVIMDVSISESMAEGLVESNTTRTPHRYWRVRSLSKRYAWNIKEIEFLDNDQLHNPNLDTVAQPRSSGLHKNNLCIQSGQYGSHGCSRAFDNNYDASWSNWAAGSQSQTWIGTDFGSTPKDIVHVRVMPGRPQAANANIVVEWSDDKSNWTEWSGNRFTTRAKSQSQSAGSRTNTWDELVVPKPPTLAPKISFAGAMVQSKAEMLKAGGNTYRYQFSAPLGDGSVSVRLHGQDLAGNLINENPTSGGSWKLDNTAPNGTVLIQAGDANSNNRRVGLQLQASDSNGITGYLISETDQSSTLKLDDFTQVSNVSNFSITLNHDLSSSGDGSKTMYGWYRDHAGNIGGPFTDTILLDTTNPLMTLVNGSSPPVYTNASTISVTIQLTETSKVSLSGKCGPKTFNNQSSGALDFGSLAEGKYDDCVLKAIDIAGNQSADLTISEFDVDRTVPSGVSLVLSGGETQTEMENITVVVKGQDPGGIERYCVTESVSTPSDGDGCWKNANSTSSLDQSFSYSLSTGFNSKTVKLWVRDRAGNVSSTSSSIIKVDRTVPSGVSLVLSGGETQTEMENITVVVKGQDPGGIQRYCVSESTSTPSDGDGCWKNVNGITSLDQSSSFALSTGFNSKTVKLWIKDRAGNMSSTSSSILRVDPNQPPSLAKSWVEDFKSFNDASLEGQDGWKVVKRNTGGQIYLESNFGVDGSRALKFHYGGSGVGNRAHKIFSGNDNPFPKSSQGTFVYEADIIKLCWGAFLGPAYDANNNGVVDDSEQGPGFWIVGGCGGNKLRARLADGTTRDISLSGSSWFRIRFEMDLAANQGQGSGKLFFKSLTDGETTWRTNSSLTNFNLKLDPNANNSSNPAKWNALWLHFEGATAGLDNILIETGGSNHFTLRENPANNHLIGKITASDPNSDPLNFSITSGNSDGAFRIDSGNGNLFVNDPSKFDYETKTEHTLTVRVTDGKLSDSANIQIQLQDVPETDGQYALKFDGNNDYLLINDNPSLSNTNQLTISGWFKKESGSSWMALVGKGTSDANEEYVLALNDSQIYFDVGAGSGPYLQQNASIRLGQWQHIAAVHSRNGSNSSLKVYLDGEDIGGSVRGASYTPNDNNLPLTIGVRTSNLYYNQWFKGEIDNVQIWSKALSQQEIRERMGTTIDVSDSLWQNLEAYYRMDWGNGSTAFDYSANGNHGTLTNGPEWVESHHFDKGLFAHYKLNGNTRESNGNTIGNPIETDYSEDRHGYAKGTAKFNGNGWVNLNKTSSKESATSLGLPKKDITLSAWVNPQSFGTWVALVGYLQDNGADENGWALGLWSDKRYYFAVSGTTNNRLKYLYSSQTRNINQWVHLVGTYDGSTMKFYLDGTLSSNSNVVSGNIKYKDSWLALGTYKDDNEDFRINGKLDDVRIYNRVLSAEEVSKLYNYEKEDPFKDGLVAHYPFSGNANDASGKGKNATVSGPTLTKDRFDQSNKAYEFDGSNDFISTPNNLINFGIKDQFTLSTWFNVESDGSTYRMLMEDGSDYRYDSIYLGLRSGSDKVFAKLGRTTGSQVANDSIPSPYLYGDWKQLVYKYDGSKISLYLNGHPFYSKNVSGDLLSGNRNLEFGRRPSGTHYYNGKLDDVRIYNKALSDEKITELYDLEKPANPVESIPGLSLWFDATNVDGLANSSVSNGSKLSKWVDLSGNNLDVQQSTESYKPTFSGHSITFDGSDDRLENTTLNYGLLSEDASIFVALKPTSNRGLIIDQSFGHGGNERGWNLHRGDDDWATIPADSVVWNSHNYVGNQNYNMYAYSKQNTSPTNQKQIISVVKDGNKLSFDVNGSSVEMEDDTLYASTITYNSGYKLNVGRKVFGPDYLGYLPYKGEIFEIIVISRNVTTKEKVDIQSYLSNKWDLESRTDVDGDGFLDSIEISNNSDPKDPSSKPQNIPSIVGESKLWLLGNNVDGLKNTTLSNGSNITRWVDFSGNGNDAKISNSSYYPSLATNSQNSLSTVFFDSDYIEFNDIYNVRSVFLILNKTTPTEAWKFFLGDDNSYHFHGGNGTVFANSSWTHTSIYPNGKVYQDGKEINPKSTNFKSGYQLISLVTSGNVEASQIGGDRGIHSQMWKGNIAEILIYDKAVSDNNRYSINHYLAKKWGLLSTVDSDGDGQFDSSDAHPSEFHVSLYDFNNLSPVTPEEGNSSGEDNWEHAVKYRGFVITTSGSYDGTVIMKYKNSGPGIGVSSSRVNDENFKLPPFKLSDTSASIQFDFQSGHWGGGFGVGYDINGDGRLHYTKGDFRDPNELGPAIYVGTKCSKGVSIINPSGGGSKGNTNYSSVSSIGCDNSDNNYPSEWIRYKLTIDFDANNGQGSGSLEYMNLSRGDSNFQQVNNLQNINLGFQTNSNTGSDPEKWDGMWFSMEGRPYAIDNIIFTRNPN